MTRNPSRATGALSWPPTFPASVRDLETRHHAVFEASAGTGKTYAIEHLVLRLLVENAGWKPEEILLLSFTEKTAADLRKRIRDRLHAEWAGSGSGFWTAELRERIRKVWLHCDDLAIHTIHGFCHAALLRYPIANNALIRPDVVDDKTIAREALENLLRGAWSREPGKLAALREALDISAGDWWRDKLIHLALAYNPLRGDRMEPERDPGAWEKIRNESLAALHDVMAALEKVNRSEFSLDAYLQRLPDSKRSSNAFGKVSRILAAERDESAALLALLAAFYGKYEHGKEKEGKTKAFKNGFEAELDGTRGRVTMDRREWMELASACTRAVRLSLTLQRAEVLESLGLQGDAARELREELAREKRRRGAISYDDMTQSLATALAENPELAPRLRRLYKACIVDEFQDTDWQQWEILQKLCLDGTPCGTPEATEARGNGAALPLFLVGDPKQAIYAFRGGDLQTYLAARDRLRALAETDPPRAQGVGLVENFRSSPELIEGLNAIFGQPAWFGASGAIPTEGPWQLSASRDIVFTPVIPGGIPADAMRSKGAPAVWIRDLRPAEDEKPGKAKVERALRNWIAARILDLVTGRGGLQIARKAPDKGVQEPGLPRYGDIAILVRKHAEAEALEKLLRARNIPCRVRRTGGVFHGEGADALRLLLDLISTAADPATQAKILLLPFLRREGMDWPQGRPALPPRLLERWIFLSQAGRWPEFFDSVLRDSGHLARLAETSESDAARLLALGRALGEAGSTPGTSAAALADRFDALRRGEGEGDEGVVEEGEELFEETAATGGAVTLMTLHMSKGLEFPVVFLAAAGAGRKPDFYTLRDASGFRHVLDKKDADAKRQYAEQSEAEDKRLYYVAFTRAKDRLYVPLLPGPNGSSDYGPLGGFAAEALQAVASDPGQMRTHADTDALHFPSAPGAGNGAPPETGAGVDNVTEITAGETGAHFSRQRKLDSYSGLAKRTVEKAAPEDLLEEDGTRAVRESPPDSTDPAGAATDRAGEAGTVTAISREDLPPGAAAGNVLHKVLEHTEFASVLAAESPAAWLEQPHRRALAEDLLRQEGLDPACAGAIARAVWNTLRMPLPDPARPGSTFRLADVADGLHEMEFLFPIADHREEEQAADTEPLPEKTERSGNFLWGFIDLIFRHQGRYYVLDWKSNLLDSYDADSVRASMEQSHYDLQWQLYSVALHRWLTARLPGYDSGRHFGGVFYLYLRGAAPDHFSGFAHLPDAEDLHARFPKRLAGLLGLRTTLVADPDDTGGLP